MQHRPENRRERDRHAELRGAQEQKRVRGVAKREDQDDDEHRPEPTAHRLAEIHTRGGGSTACDLSHAEHGDEHRDCARDRGVPEHRAKIDMPPRKHGEREQRTDDSARIVRRAVKAERATADRCIDGVRNQRVTR